MSESSEASVPSTEPSFGASPADDAAFKRLVKRGVARPDLVVSGDEAIEALEKRMGTARLPKTGNKIRP
jgi:hypothetical protein